MSHKVLSRTKSVCPQCLGRIDAQYVEKEGQVWMEKSCPEHGDFSALIWHDADGWESWHIESRPQPPAHPEEKSVRGCPYDCGLCSEHIQASCCVLLEVTGRCDLGCPVCYAGSGGAAPPDPDLDTIAGWYDMLLRQGGPFNIQLSGGEPAMRDDLPLIIRMGRERGFRFFQLNTNGLRISREPDYLSMLINEGLSAVFLQFDALSDEVFQKMRGRALLDIKLRAIENCARAGVGVILVPTVALGINDHCLGEIVDFAAECMPAVRGVHFQPMSYFGRGFPPAENGERLTVPLLLQRLEEQTRGRIRAEHFRPGSAEHPLCTFHADYEITDEKWILQKKASSPRCCPPGGSSDLARDSVARKWSLPANDASCCEKPGMCDLRSLDEFLDKKKNRTLALSGMAFQDAHNLDIARLRQCHVHIVSPWGTLIPFCAYNLTDCAGKGLYRV